MRIIPIIASLVGLAPCVVAAENLGDHPSINVERLQADNGYDYLSKFYPHPAWLYLLPEAPAQEVGEAMERVAKRQTSQVALPPVIATSFVAPQ